MYGHNALTTGPVMSTVDQVSNCDQTEAGTSMEELSLLVISEARVEKDDKTFFALKTQAAPQKNEKQQGKNMFPLVNLTQDLPLHDQTHSF